MFKSCDRSYVEEGVSSRSDISLELFSGRRRGRETQRRLSFIDQRELRHPQLLPPSHLAFCPYPIATIALDEVRQDHG